MKSEALRFHRDIQQANEKAKEEEKVHDNQQTLPPVNNFDVDSVFNKNSQANRGRQIENRGFTVPRQNSSNRDPNYSLSNFTNPVGPSPF